MPLNLGSGEFTPYVKYNSKADKWFTKGETGDVEIPRPTFIVDLPSTKTGWFLLKEGVPPSIVLDPSIATPAAKPTAEHKRGFKVRLFSQACFGGDGVVELTGASMHVCAAYNDLYSTCEAQQEANPGMLPVVAVTGATSHKDKYGTNYRPIFSLQKWVTPPAALTEAAASQPASASNANSTNPPPVAAAPAPPRAAVSEF